MPFVKPVVNCISETAFAHPLFSNGCIPDFEKVWHSMSCLRDRVISMRKA